jgi:hypothetical protein
MTAENTADIAVLMPKIEDERRFSIRYAGLEGQLRHLGVVSCFLDGHVSYDAANGHFNGSLDTDLERSTLAVRPRIIRDLTMPDPAKEMLLYNASGPRLVHHPAVNRFLADKTEVAAEMNGFQPSGIGVTDHDGVEMAFDMLRGSRLIFKPAIGSNGQDIQIVRHPKEVVLKPSTKYLAQELLDTSIGMSELGIEGVHNLRVISIDSNAIGAVARFGGDNPDMLQDDIYGPFIHPEDLPERTQHIVERVHQVLRWRAGEGKNVIAIDVMRGIDPGGEQVEVLCEVNRRPLRISSYDLLDSTSQSQAGIAEMANRWDKAEAEMLVGLLD